MFIAHLVLPLIFQASKLGITDTVVGKGPVAVAGDFVSVDYTGKLTNGKQFDSSIGRAPFQFMIGAGQVIKGWDLGVAGMHEGGTRLLTIPSDLAYGDAGAGSDIPAKATLKFEIRLIKIEPRAKVEVLAPGKGAKAAFGDTVEVRYKGSLTDGKEFDSSKKHGDTPLKVQIGGRVIPGFTQGLIGIQEGERRRVTIPAALAYGARQIPPADTQGMKAGSIIPANSILIFEIEAVKLTPAPKELKNK